MPPAWASARAAPPILRRTRRFWGLDVWDGYNRQWVPGVFVWYRGANGKIYMYDTDRMQWQTLVRCLPEE